MSMKKILFLGLLLFLGLGLAACGQDNGPQLSNDDYKQFLDLFKGDWNMPGLYEKDGSEHTMPAPVTETGMEINVLDYGAKANNANEDNFSAFKKAIDNASPGDTVFIPNGDYYFKNYRRASEEYDTHIALTDGITLRGESQNGVRIISCFSESKNETDNTTVIAAVNVNNVAIKNLTVTSNTSDDVLPDNTNSNLQSLIYTAPKYGITAASGGVIADAEDQASNILIEGVTVEKFQRMGVRIAKAKEVVVKNSTFQKATCLGGGGMGYGVNIQGLGNGFDCTDSFVDTCFNIVENCNFVGPWLRHGALIQYSAHNNVIRNNKFDDILLDSIDMHGEDEYSNEICNNVIHNTRRGAGIGLGNTGATHDASGRNNFIHDNEIKNGARGIDILLGTPNTIVFKNTIDQVENGIRCSNANGTRIVENTLSNIEGTAISVTYSYVYGNPSLGLPSDYKILSNTIKSCGKGVYLDSKGNNFVLKDTKFEGMDEKVQIVDESGSFVIPDATDLTSPVQGNNVLPKENFFITMESKSKPAQYQKNLKLKSSALEPMFNRMIYALFDKKDAPTTYDKVYLSITAKAQEGTPTINIFSNTTYTDWTTDSICWDNSKLHQDTLALIKNSAEDPVQEFTTFTFPFAEYEFHTYYIDVTEAYKAIGADVFTLVLTNENVDGTYMEVYSKEQTANDFEQAFRLIFTN